MATKKQQKIIEKGRVYITSTFNNTLVTITDDKGNTLGWGSAGGVGFKGTRKSTPFAATTAVDQVAKKIVFAHGLRSVDVYIKGPGAGRDAALRALKSAGLSISMIADVTPMPHNGVRPKKKRRV
ncbi:30S ribosomal protein S11 [Patescibacteria group bacterium]|nr:30S ribosomal protein S11 [Patescibacteria group bacterium]MCL5797267.1 30S ribosomal protein S11 [Patescibacteria group bacterium]